MDLVRDIIGSIMEEIWWQFENLKQQKKEKGVCQRDEALFIH